MCHSLNNSFEEEAQRPMLPVYIDGFPEYMMSSCDPDDILPVRLLYYKSM
jgi:hypothetical protein